ncbi:hypothetical protein CEXT_181901 [Caerostris extrusa]|uniref:Uncharacterized protein n=1 Tax=Caerostris extrusa TaxID=172846 RepID=A0AAV4QQH8_CAEEX|nr:hypothetical protein CEXT_181901 [Caerostris extrusa]
MQTTLFKNVSYQNDSPLPFPFFLTEWFELRGGDMEGVMEYLCGRKEQRLSSMKKILEEDCSKNLDCSSGEPRFHSFLIDFMP